MSSQSISRHLARFIYSLSLRDLPSKVVSRAKNLLLDALATAIAAHDLPYPSIALAVVSGNKGNATIFTYGLRVPPVDATFVNAILINSIAQDDVLYMFHPGAVIIPAALATSEEEGSSGAEVITAIVAGYDVMGRLFLAAPNIVPRFRALSVFGPFGAAAAAGKLLKLNEDQLTNALGYAANLSSGFLECWTTGTMEGKFHTGIASRNGIMAATLAREGATAAEKSLEGKSGFYQAFAGTTEGLDAATADLGKRFLIMDAKSKVYPACGMQQVPIDLALTLVKEHDIRAKDIAKVIEIVPQSTFSYPGANYAGPFTTHFQATMSAQFCTAAAFLGKPVASHSFYEKSCDDPEVFELAKKVELIGENERDTTRVEVTLRDGRKYSVEGGEGEMLVPTTDKIRVKFRNLAYDFLAEKKVDKVIDIVLNLDKLDNIRQLTHWLGE